MHMADALISPVVGGVMWAASAGLASHAAKKVQRELDDRKIPVMAVLGAFVFAAQMINFTIPGTGSSGHLGGGLLLAILLGPSAAFLTMSSILTIQALFFADGGLLALGCNIFNLGFFPCFIAYPLIFKPWIGSNPSAGRLFFASVITAVLGLQAGALGVVLETVMSGISDLPFTSFALLMQPIHLAIGLVEGFITAAVVGFVWREVPSIIEAASVAQPATNTSVRRIVTMLMIATICIAGSVSWFASTQPDGLEWSIARVTGEDELQIPAGIHTMLAEIQGKIAFLPDYNFKQAEQSTLAETNDKELPAWPAIDTGTSFAGIAGSVITLLMAYIIGKGLRAVARH